jgi:hypothetical protein
VRSFMSQVGAFDESSSKYSSSIDRENGVGSSISTLEAKPRLSLSTLLEINLEALWRLNSHFLHTFCREE